MSLRTVAETAGVTRRTLYYHFASKDVLVGRYLERRDVASRAMVANMGEGATTPGGRIVAVFTALEGWFRSREFRGCALGNAVGENGETLVVAGPITRRHKKALAAWFVRTCAAGACDDPHELGEALMIVFDGALTSAATRADPTIARRAARIARVLMAEHGLA